MNVFKRQHKFFIPEISKDVTIIGAGSIGSFVALTLAKMGVGDIQIFDSDIVEEHNIPNQFYRMSDINRNKVDAIGEIIKDFASTNVNLKTINTKFPSSDWEETPIVISAVDSLTAREEIFKYIIEQSEKTIYFIDVRVGGEVTVLYTVNLINVENIDKYLKSLQVRPKKLPCGAQSIIYNILTASAHTAHIVKQICNNEPVPFKITISMTTRSIIIED